MCGVGFRGGNNKKNEAERKIEYEILCLFCENVLKFNNKCRCEHTHTRRTVEEISNQKHCDAVYIMWSLYINFFLPPSTIALLRIT